MLDAMNIAATGMRTQQLNVETIANNMANVNTIGFKKSRVNFVDLVANGTDASALAASGASGAPGLPALDTVAHLGAGVAVNHVDRVFGGGELRKTGNALDLAINGDGFLEVTRADGSVAYTRGGSFRLNSDGVITTAAGEVLKPEITVPQDAQSVTLQPDGRVLVTTPTSTQPIQLGQVSLVRFTNPGALDALGNDLFTSNANAGDPITAHAGEDGMGTIQQGFLEASNVQLVDEMVGLMVAQRAYEASVKVVQASDEMMGMVNNLRK